MKIPQRRKKKEYYTEENMHTLFEGYIDRFTISRLMVEQFIPSVIVNGERVVPVSWVKSYLLRCGKTKEAEEC